MKAPMTTLHEMLAEMAAELPKAKSAKQAEDMASEVAILAGARWKTTDLPLPTSPSGLGVLAAAALAQTGSFAAERSARFECVAQIAEPEDLDDWLVDGFLRPRALAILASAEGIGKSYMRDELAIRLATGTGALFGHYAIRAPARVVLIDEENGPAEEWRREAQILDSLNLDRSGLERYFRCSFAGQNLANPEHQRQLRADLEALAPDLTIFDTGGSMIGDEWGEPLKEAVRFLRSLPGTKLVCVHLTKPARNSHGAPQQHGSELSAVMGQWTRSADSVAIVTDLGAGRARWTLRKRVPPSQLILARRAGLWETVAVAEDQAAASLDTRVLRAIAAGAASAAELCIALGADGRALPKRSLYNALRRLRADGFIGDGTPLALTDTGIEAAE